MQAFSNRQFHASSIGIRLCHRYKPLLIMYFQNDIIDQWSIFKAVDIISEIVKAFILEDKDGGNSNIKKKEE